MLTSKALESCKSIEECISLLQKTIEKSNSSKKKEKVTEDLPNSFGNALINLSQSSKISFDNAERFISLIGKFIELPYLENGVMAFTSSDRFLSGIIQIIICYAKSLDTSISFHTPYSSHYCYELSLYILLGLIEKSAYLANFIKTINTTSLNQLFLCLGSVINKDSLYLTQEMSLEIMARISHYMSGSDSKRLGDFLSSLPPLLLDILKAGKSEILGLLRNMRPVLNKLNLTNINIRSYMLLSVAYDPSGSPSPSVTQAKALKHHPIDTFIDFCDEFICFHINALESFIRFSYKGIVSSQIVEEVKAIRLELLDPPAKLLEHMNYSTPKGQKKSSEGSPSESVQVYFFFESVEVCQLAHTFLITRVHSLKDSLKMNKIKKLAISSTKRHEEILSSLHLLAINNKKIVEAPETNETVSSLSSIGHSDDEEDDQVDNLGARELKRKQMKKVEGLSALGMKKPATRPKRGSKKSGGKQGADDMQMEIEPYPEPLPFSEEDPIEEFTAPDPPKDRGSLRVEETSKKPSRREQQRNEENWDPHTGKHTVQPPSAPVSRPSSSHGRHSAFRVAKRDFDTESVASVSSHRSLKRKFTSPAQKSFGLEEKFDFPVALGYEDLPMDEPDPVTESHREKKRNKSDRFSTSGRSSQPPTSAPVRDSKGFLEEGLGFEEFSMSEVPATVFPESPPPQTHEKPKASRFYSPSLAEISKMSENPSFLYEGEGFTQPETQDQDLDQEFNQFFSGKAPTGSSTSASGGGSLPSSHAFLSNYSSLLQKGGKSSGESGLELDEDYAQDNNILSLLIQEIVKIQKKRTVKKNLKLLELLTSSSASQLLAYLTQWKQFHFYLLSSFFSSAQERVKKLKGRNHTNAQEMQSLLTRVKDRTGENTLLKSEILKSCQKYAGLVASLKQSQQRDTQELKANIRQLKRNILDRLLQRLSGSTSTSLSASLSGPRGGTGRGLSHGRALGQGQKRKQGELDSDEEEPPRDGQRRRDGRGSFRSKGAKAMKIGEDY